MLKFLHDDEKHYGTYHKPLYLTGINIIACVGCTIADGDYIIVVGGYTIGTAVCTIPYDLRLLSSFIVIFFARSKEQNKAICRQIMAGYGRLRTICHNYTAMIVRVLSAIYGRWQVFEE